MFIMDKEEVDKLLSEGKIMSISRFDTVDNAVEFYNNEEGTYVCYEEVEPKFAKATPVMVFKFIKK